MHTVYSFLERKGTLAVCGEALERFNSIELQGILLTNVESPNTILEELFL